MLTRALALLGVWTVAAVVLGWGHLPARLRRVLSLVTSAAGLLFLVLALNTAGQREATTWSDFLLGTGYLTGKATASASLPYYVMTGLCLLLGTVGLALPERGLRWIRRHWVAGAVILSIGVTVLRLLLERSAAPPQWAWAAGITALAPLIGGWFWLNARAEGRGWPALAGALVIYGLAVRLWLTALYAAATTFGLGSTHFNIAAITRARNPLTGRLATFEAGSLEQLTGLVVMPQLLFWPVYTLVAGLLGAGIAWIASRALHSGGLVREGMGVGMAPLRQD